MYLTCVSSKLCEFIVRFLDALASLDFKLSVSHTFSDLQSVQPVQSVLWYHILCLRLHTMFNEYKAGSWIPNFCMMFHLVTKFPANKVTLVMVSTHGFVVSLAMFLDIGVVYFCIRSDSNTDSFLWVSSDFDEESVLFDVVPAAKHLVGHKP